jgi:uncharacterized membrane protein
MSSFYITLRETIEFSLIVILLIGVHRDFKKSLFRTSIFTIIAGIVMTTLNYPLPGLLEQAYTDVMFYSFLLILILSCLAGKNMIYPLICVFLALFLPSAQLTSVITEEFYLRGGSVLFGSFAGALTGIILFALGLRFSWTLNFRRFFGTDGLMIFIAAFCFLFGGLNEFDGSSVIATLQHGLHRLLSLFFSSEQLYAPYLSPRRIAMALTALILFVPPLYVIVKLLLTPEPVTDSIEIGAEKRKIVSVYRDKLLYKGTPLIVSFLVIIVILHSANVVMNPVHDPEPIPVVVDGNTITIPLSGLHGEASASVIRKYSFRHGGKAYRFMLVKRLDNEVIPALDACEICPPEGYIQRGEHVICKYCSSPISLHSVGLPGGCNPIPIAFDIKGDSLTVFRDNIVDMYHKWIGTD